GVWPRRIAQAEVKFSRKNDTRSGPNHVKSGPKPHRATGLNRHSKLPASGPTAISGLRIGSLALIAASLIAAPLFAQGVPIPKPAPKGRDIQLSPPDPIIPDPRRNQPANIFATFDANQKAQAAKVSAYLSSLQTLVGNFVQVGPDGSKTKGDFYIQKPGKVRFEYDPPSPVELIADGSSLAVRDKRLATQDIYPLS